MKMTINGPITIGGKTYQSLEEAKADTTNPHIIRNARNITFDCNGKMTIDGREHPMAYLGGTDESQGINLCIIGDVEHAETYNGSITIQGNCHTVSSKYGSISCHDVEGNAESKYGSVQCHNVKGDADSKYGSVQLMKFNKQ